MDTDGLSSTSPQVEQVLANVELPVAPGANRKLANAEDAGGKLSEGHNASRGLPQTKQGANRELPNRDDAECRLT